MDHRWDNAVHGLPGTREEQELYGARAVEEDPDVLRRDGVREQEDALRGGSGAPRGVRQLSPWEIGIAFHDQRDLYTRDSRVDAAGYGRGPSHHPTDGSYAYHRDAEVHAAAAPATDANVDERRAWPWLNYHDLEQDPFFFRRYEHGLWDRMKSRVSSALHIGGDATGSKRDQRIKEDVADVLAFRGDIDASDIEVTVANAEVTLAGTVPDRRTKRAAEETAEGIRGVRDVHNRLTVRHVDPTDANTAFVLPLSLLGGA